MSPQFLRTIMVGFGAVLFGVALYGLGEGWNQILDKVAAVVAGLAQAK